VNRRPWIKAEVKALRTLYPHIRTEDVAKILGRNERAVYNKAGHIGLRKSKAFLASTLSGRNVKGYAPHGLAGRFKAGHAPWNAGIRFEAGGRSPLTRFKRGQKPHNTKPIGSYRITKDGTLQRKVSNDQGSNSKRWRGVHELVWIEAIGPVPAGHIVVFKPGMKTSVLQEITPDRVECISWAENMRRNTYHRYPKPIALAIQLRGALNRQINRRLGEKQD
jgi:hypothetical protein